MKRLRVAAIGAGAFGRHHVRHLAAHPAVAALTVVDQDLARAQTLAASHAATAAAGAQDLALDAAVIAVPTEAHAALALPLLSRGVPVFIEKPIAQTADEAARLIAAAEASGAFIQVGHIERFSPAFEALAAAAQSPHHIVAVRHNPPRPVPPTVDVVRDLMIHDIDLAIALAGADVERVDAMALTGRGEDAATARLTFANGVVADLSASRLAPVVTRTLTAYGTLGVVHADLARKTVHRTVNGSVDAIPFETARDNLAAEIDEFLHSVMGDARPRVDGQGGAAALAVADRVRAAIGTAALTLSA